MDWCLQCRQVQTVTPALCFPIRADELYRNKLVSVLLPRRVKRSYRDVGPVGSIAAIRETIEMDSLSSGTGF